MVLENKVGRDKTTAPETHSTSSWREIATILFIMNSYRHPAGSNCDGDVGRDQSDKMEDGWSEQYFKCTKMNCIA